MSETGDRWDDASFWDKVKHHAIRAGREVIERALTLYYCLEDADTPAWARTVIVGALAYFILPADAVPDWIPGVGFTDDLGALAAAASTVYSHLKPEHARRASERSAEWFGKATPDD